MKFDRFTISLLLIQFIKSTQITLMAPLFPVVFTQRSIALHWAGVNMLAFMISMAVMSIFSGYTMQTFGAKKLFWLSIAQIILYPLLLISAYLFSENNAIFVCTCIFGSIIGGSGSAIQSTVTQSLLYLLYHESRSIVSAMLNLAVCFGFMAGFVIGQALFNLGGFSAPLSVTLVALLLTMPFLGGISEIMDSLYSSDTKEDQDSQISNDNYNDTKKVEVSSKHLFGTIRFSFTLTLTILSFTSNQFIMISSVLRLNTINPESTRNGYYLAIMPLVYLIATLTITIPLLKFM